jgi:Spy/CpxP family protein refolding chaperone
VTIASMAARSSVRQQLLWVVFTLSLALNLCFVAGALWIRFHGPPQPNSPEERLQQIEPQLALNPQQKQAFDLFAQTVGSRMQSLREANEPVIGNAWSELAKPDADETRVMQLFEEAAQQRRSFRRDLTMTTLSFLATLSPEQRAKFVELARQRPWGKRHLDGSP